MTDAACANADDALGFRGWAKTPPMEFTKRFRPLIAWHGAGLFRLSENALRLAMPLPSAQSERFRPT